MIKAPYPWFGGKSIIMPEVWKRLGDTYNLVDPFLGSNAPLLSRPGWDYESGQWKDNKNRIETVNDKDCYISNFWRAVHDKPDEVAKWADWPVNEADLHARHKWLVENEDFVERMKTDPHYYDAQVAGWWVWGLCIWIGGNWCKLLYKRLPHLRSPGQGINRTSLSRKRPDLGKRSGGRGIHRTSLSRSLPHIGHSQGINRTSLSRNLPSLRRSQGINSQRAGDIYSYFDQLAARLRRVRVCCGDWSRVLGPTPTYANGLTAVILDPPYSAESGRDPNIYPQEDLLVAHEVREWAIANGDNPKLRIALFGYENEHKMPDDWEMLSWQAHGGYANNAAIPNNNKRLERVWFSPHCLKPTRAIQGSLFEVTE